MNIVAATLVILTATHGCRLDNIDRSDPVSIEMPTLEECETAAAILDKKRGVRAFCLDTQSKLTKLGKK